VNLRSIVAQERSKCNLNQKKAHLDVVAPVWDHPIFECGRLVGKMLVAGTPPNIKFLDKFPTITPARSLDYCDAMTILESSQ
jgi:hypothetical protein